MMEPREIYLDHNATAPLSPGVRRAIEDHLRSGITGNPSSSHAAGQRARALLEDARDRLLAASGLPDHTLVFTSGGTESNERAVQLLLQSGGGHPVTFVTGRLEHPSLLSPITACCPPDRIRWARLTSEGRYGLDPPSISCLVDDVPQPIVISLQAANNELGTLQDIGALRDALPDDVLVHSDASQYWLRASADLRSLRADALTVSGHKLGALPGIGGLFLHSSRLPHRGTVTAQEGGRRPGTENLLGILSFAAAVDERRAAFESDVQRQRALRDDFVRRLLATSLGLAINNPTEPRLPNTVNVRFPHGDGRSILVALQLAGLAVSPGAACASGASTPSPVLQAIGLTELEARRSVRISLGPSTTQRDVDEAVRRILDVARRFQA